MKPRFAIIYFTILLLVNPIINAQISTLKLEAFYPFNGNANDESGNKNNGTVNGATLTTDRFGNANSAYSFNGIDNYILLPDSFDFTERTVSVWFNADTITSDLVNIYSYDHPELLYGLTYLNLQKINNTDEILYACGELATMDTVNINAKTWHHSVTVFKDNTAKYYLDCQFVGQKSIQSYIPSDQGLKNFVLGTSRLLNKRFFNGKIDEVMIYNRILDSAEILALCNYIPAEINGSSDVCQGQKGVSYNAMGMDSILSYDWSYSGTGATITGNTENILVDFSNDASSGSLKVIGTKICNCAKDSAIFEVTVNQTPVAIASSNSPVCSGSAINLTPQTISGGGYSWNGPNGFSSTTQNPVIIPATTANAGIYSLTVNANGCTSIPTSLIVDVYSCNSADLSVLTMVNDSLPTVGQLVVFTIIATNNGPYGAEGVKVSDILQTGYSFVSASTSSGTYDPPSGNWVIGSMNTNSFNILTITATVNPSGNYENSATIQCNEIEENMINNISITETYPTDFNIPNSFSPNGDGINDLFVIRGLTENSKLKIFNRAGKKIYESENYQNDWGGKDNDGKILDSDTYWYILSLTEDQSEFKGYVYIKN